MDLLLLLRELHDFYLPLAEEGELELVLQAPDSLPGLPVICAPRRSPGQPAE